MTYRELVYLCLDETKNISDDSTFNENHVISLLNNYRVFLIRQKYSDVESIYQRVIIKLYAWI